VQQGDASLAIDGICEVASQFTEIANGMYSNVIAQDTLSMIQGRINENVALLQQVRRGLRT